MLLPKRILVKKIHATRKIPKNEAVIVIPKSALFKFAKPYLTVG
jgi:hypothetical protein